MATFPDEKLDVDNTIDSYGTSITITPRTENTYSEDNGWTFTSSTAFTTNAIPYEYTKGKKEYESYGANNIKLISFIVKGDVAVSVKNLVTYGGVDYVVNKVNQYPLGETSIAQIIVCVENKD
jgi:hypothetical protein